MHCISLYLVYQESQSSKILITSLASNSRRISLAGDKVTFSNDDEYVSTSLVIILVCSAAAFINGYTYYFHSFFSNFSDVARFIMTDSLFLFTFSMVLKASTISLSWAVAYSLRFSSACLVTVGTASGSTSRLKSSGRCSAGRFFPTSFSE